LAGFLLHLLQQYSFLDKFQDEHFRSK